MELKRGDCHNRRRGQDVISLLHANHGGQFFPEKSDSARKFFSTRTKSATRALKELPIADRVTGGGSESRACEQAPPQQRRGRPCQPRRAAQAAPEYGPRQAGEKRCRGRKEMVDYSNRRVASGHTSSLDQLEMFIAEKNEWSALHIYVYCNKLIHTLEVLPSDTITSATTTDEQHDFTSCLKW